MTDYLIFNGIDSRDYNVWIFDDLSENTPERDVTKVQVDGRNGELTIDNGRFKNVKKRYSALIYQSFAERYQEFTNALLVNTGYLQLEDSLHPDEVYSAMFDAPVEAVMSKDRSMGRFELEFTRDARRFLKSGKQAQEFLTGGDIINPTNYSSRPRIRVYGHGNLVINNDTITIAEAFPYVDIDGEIQDCYYGNENANAVVSFNTVDFPQLASGNNGISFSGSITKVEITPNWWRL